MDAMKFNEIKAALEPVIPGNKIDDGRFKIWYDIEGRCHQVTLSIEMDEDKAQIHPYIRYVMTGLADMRNTLDAEKKLRFLDWHELIDKSRVPNADIWGKRDYFVTYPCRSKLAIEALKSKLAEIIDIVKKVIKEREEQMDLLCGTMLENGFTYDDIDDYHCMKGCMAFNDIHGEIRTRNNKEGMTYHLELHDLDIDEIAEMAPILKKINDRMKKRNALST